MLGHRAGRVKGLFPCGIYCPIWKCCKTLANAGRMTSLLSYLPFPLIDNTLNHLTKIISFLLKIGQNVCITVITVGVVINRQETET